jgi:hypothetical protein
MDVVNQFYTRQPERAKEKGRSERLWALLECGMIVEETGETVQVVNEGGRRR